MIAVVRRSDACDGATCEKCARENIVHEETCITYAVILERGIVWRHFFILNVYR